MENKKGAHPNTSNSVINDTQQNDPIPKHSHQHNTAPQHLRLLQYGLKIPNHQHQQLNSPAVHLHLHQHQQQQLYQSTSHRYLQSSPQQQYSSTSVHQNQNAQYAHQHQQKTQNFHQHSNQQLYHSNPPPPPPLHPHNPLNQQNSQIWVPHQPPVHYHQSKSEPQSQKHTNNQSQSSKPKEAVERKKSSSNASQQLRSPVAKRPPEAPVTIQGWLHKQGSEGLMLWKKRWFVLSEYCLFYYKGPEEEKLLGSVLLPSYKVSICGSEDKVNRKYAFKCEHANMRTYILAADSQELMMQWVRVLNLACLLQTNVDLEQSVQSTSTYVHSTENSDSGFYQQYNQSQQTVRNTPVHMHTSSNTTDLSNPSQQELSQYNQPLYANAPPKPRRLNDGGYSSPSPDVLDRYQPEPKYISPQPQHPYNMQPVHMIRNVAKSPVNLYNPNIHHQPEYIPQLNQQINNKHISDFNVSGVREYSVPQNVERRTPDTYGRSKTNPAKGRSPSDYEDVYADQCMYKRPLSPLAYSNVKKVNPPVITPMQRTYTPVSMLGPRDIVQYVVPQQLRKSPSNIPRPHSADFLEYEVTHRQMNPNVVNRQPRPKSSLDINRNTSNDNYFYSEERYAEKMRKSAQYLPKMPRYPPQQNEYVKRPNETDKTFPLMKSSTQPINFSNAPIEYERNEAQPTRSRSVLSEGSLSKELDVDLRSSPHNHIDRGALSPGPLTRQEPIYGYSDDARRREYDQFTRSASARLAQNAQNERMQIDGRMNREGERKREESMKRLLEWKQRMLQSPLNRKVHQNMSKMYIGKPDVYYKHPENGYPHKLLMDPYLVGRCSTSTMPQYNSYSSDDEENEERSKENMKAQAGRTVDTISSESFSPAHSTSTTVFNAPPDETPFSSDNLHATKDTSTETMPVPKDITETDDTFTKPLKLYNKEAPHIAHVSSLRSEFSEKFEQSPLVTEIKSNGALVKSILAEFERKPEDATESNDTINVDEPQTPTRDIESIIEENYMTMTPKKSILEPTIIVHDPVIRILSVELEENPYVEMTQGSDLSLLNPKNSNCASEQQPYEMICFSGCKMEPVYMELNQPVQNILNKDNKIELPDILMPSQNKKCKSNKSDSSDADDEASKDLDSLDTPSHPRFSLSDTFRPASYYLGASQAAPELQDSSDSELVSPPPIPRSPPPLDELDECTTNNQAIESEKTDNIYRYTQRNSDQYFNSNNKFKYKKGSTRSLDVKKQSFLSLTSLKDGDSSSLCSINTDTDHRYGSRLSHNSDSDIELRTHISRTSEYERMLKRRPVSEEFRVELESLNSRFNETIDSAELDKYLKDLQVSNVGVISNEMNVRDYMHSPKLDDNQSTFKGSFHDYENLCVVGQNKIDNVNILSNLTSSVVHSHKRENSRDTVTSRDTVDSRDTTTSRTSRETNISMLSASLTHSHSRENSKDTINTQNSSTLHSEFGDHRSLMSPDYVHRSRPDSSTSIMTEINGFLHHSRRSTPSIRAESVSTQEISQVSLYFHDGKNEQGFNQSAPYYYSDLSMNTSHTDSTSTILTLNNQRSAMIGSKRDITHIINPIRCNTRSRNSVHNPRQNLIDNTFKLAAEARSVSVDFLNLTDKSGQIDKKNIYESDTLKRLKAMDSITSLQSNPETRNLYPSSSNEKFIDLDCGESNVRRSHSLEGLLENVLSETNDVSVPISSGNALDEEIDRDRGVTEGSYLWEEDSIWRERLRSASQRHTKSLDDLDCIGEPKKEKQKKQARGITRGVTYVNDNIYNMPLHDKHQKDLENKKQVDNNKSDNKSKDSFIIDREKLRQWDLMSSAPSDAQISSQCTQGVRVNNMVVDMGDEVIGTQPSDQTNIQEQASGSICINNRDTFPKAISAKRIWTPNSQPMQSRSSTNLARGHESDYSLSDRQAYYMSQGPSHHSINSDTMQSNTSRKGNWQWGGRINVSAGELLGRTHEELVLLLIQLRRQSTNTCNAIEACYNEIDSIQAQLHLMDTAKRLENLQKLEQIKQHLLELEKQYEKGKPLVNLVDNMVKLGSLYRSPNDRNLNPYVRDRLEFNQQIQERRLLAEERRDWNRLNPNHTQLQEKVQQLYQLDRLIQEESGTLQGLQQDKEEIERALGGLRHRLNKGYNDPAEVEQARKQQAILENELSRVHLMLAQNSKKLEETVAGNARLEQELLVLKQKLQISRQQRSSPQFSNAGDSLPCVVGTSAMLESDLQKVQQKVGDLQRQRQELSMQVRQLTDRSNNLQQQIKPFSSNSSANNQVLGNKKKMQSLWRETDLDTMNIIDHGDSWENSASTTPTTPLYINTDLKQNSDSDFYNRSLKSSDSTSEDTVPSSNFMPQEKPEIKTVRIVKRESERRQRDREKTSTGKWDPLLEEETTSSQNSSVLFRPTPVQKTQSSTNVGDSPSFTETDKASCALSRQSSLSSPSLPSFPDMRAASSDGSMDKSPELSPVFQSEAARQIITEMSNQETPKQINRRTIPKEKRRHYTAPNNNLIMKSLNQLPTDDNAFNKIHGRRARDDLDMERALRQRIDAPDVVRSTLSNKELKYNENTIDNILGTPNKINIPERYIPEQLPQLSAEEQEHRLRKVESIKKMLSDTTIISSSSANLATEDVKSENSPSNIVNKATTTMVEEKKQREHLLQLNQILAKQVMEMSKIVAAKALAKLPLEQQQLSTEDEDLSPETPLPIYQQRDNFYS